MATTSDIRNGMVIKYKDDYYKVVDFQHIKTARGGAKIRTKLKNVKTGQVLDNTFRSGEKIIDVRLEAREMQYLYHDGINYYFMDTNNYEQLPIPDEIFKEASQFVKENEIVKLLFHNNVPIDIELPIFVELKVTDTEPGVKGDTATGGSKPATLETGYSLQVPLFINEGDIIRVDTRDGSYNERVS